jgi:catalase-peroxidase
MPRWSASEPEGSSIEHQGFGWISSFESGMAGHTITSGIEGAWTATPTKWDDSYFKTLFGHEWELSKSPPARTSGIPRAAPPRTPCRTRTTRTSATRR